MAFRFFLGYYERTYTQTRSNGIITNHTGVVTSTTPTWLMDFSFTTEEINVNDDSNMYDLGSQLTQIIGSKVFSDGGKVFNSALAYLYAPVILEGETAQFTLYYRAKPEDEFQPYVSTGNALEMGDYGILFNKLKTVTFDGISYKDAVDSTTPLRTDETFTLDCNNAAGYFNLATIDNHYVAQVEYNFNDLEGALNTDAFPILPKYFNSLDSYRKNPHELDVIADNPLYKVEGDVTTLSLWGMDTFTLVGILASELYTLKLDARCYETNKAPVQVHAMYYNSATEELLHETTSNTVYAIKEINKADYFDGSSIEWSSAVATLIPDDATIVMDSTNSKIDFIKDEGIYLKYNAVYYVYPSKFLVNKSIYIDGTQTSSAPTAINLGVDTYAGIFPSFLEHKIKTNNDAGEEVEETIKVSIDHIELKNTRIEDMAAVITFKSVYGTSINTLAGYYARYLYITVVYHGNNIYESTDSTPIRFYSNSAVTANGTTAKAIDFVVDEETDVQIDTRDLQETLTTAISFKSDRNVTTSTSILTRDVDCSVTVTGAGNSQKIKVTPSEIDTFFTQDTTTTFHNFVEAAGSSLLSNTLEHFLTTCKDHKLHVYGSMYPAKQVRVNNSPFIALECTLFNQQGTIFGKTSSITIDGMIYQYYGRSFKYREWVENYVQKNNLTWTQSDGGASINYKEALLTEVKNSNTSQYQQDAYIEYSSSSFSKKYNVSFVKELDTTEITIPANALTVTSSTKTYAQYYHDYTWKHEGEVKISLPSDIIDCSLNSLIDGGELILISTDKKPARNMYSDIQLDNGCFPTKLIDAGLTDKQGVVDSSTGSTLEYKYGINFDGIMGLYCTAFGHGNNNANYTVMDLLNNEHTKKHMNAASKRTRFIIAAVGAGGSGATGHPQNVWCRSSGGGGGSGSFGCWYIDLEKIATAHNVSIDKLWLKTSGGTGASRTTGRNNDGSGGSNMTITIGSGTDTIYVTITLPAGGGGKRNSGNGGGGGSEPTEVLNKPESKYCQNIIRRKGVDGKEGDDQWDEVSSSSDIGRTKPEQLVIDSTAYQDFLKVRNNFIGTYLDIAAFGAYKTKPQYSKTSSHDTYSSYTINKNDWAKRKNLLDAEVELKKLYNNPYGHTLYELFYGNYYYQRPIAVDHCALGGTGAPSMCGFPTYWLLNGNDRSSRFPGNARVTGNQLTAYYEHPCPGCGGAGGSATYHDWFENWDSLQSDGRPGGHAYWAIFC